jgi:hypothetical protein
MSGAPEATHYVDVAGTIDVGVASLREHAAYIEGLGTSFDPDGFLRGNARAAGAAAGVDFAATFRVYEL